MSGDMNSCAASLRPRDVRNGLAINVFSAIWAVSFVGATALVAFLDPPAVLAAAIVAVPLGVSFLVLRSYRKFLAEADELLRKTHLEALCLGAGAALSVGTTFLLLLPLGASAPWGLALTLTALCLGYTYGVIRGLKAYRE